MMKKTDEVLANDRSFYETEEFQKSRRSPFQPEGSVREIDDNGFLHVMKSPLTREQVAPYRGCEIPAWETLDLEPNKVYFGWRPAHELSSPETIKSVNGIPIHLNHHNDFASAPQKESRVGSTGTDGAWEEPFLMNSLHITDQNAIDRINDGSMRELSLSYKYRPEWKSGTTPDGQKYDFIMRDIRANHLALVDDGRAGEHVLVWDSDSIKPKEIITNDLEKGNSPMKEEALTFVLNLLAEKGVKPEELEDVKAKIQALNEPTQASDEIPAPAEPQEEKAEIAVEEKPEEQAQDAEEEAPAESAEAPAEPVAEEPKDQAEDAEPEESPAEEPKPEEPTEEALVADDDDDVAEVAKSVGIDLSNEEIKKAFLAGLNFGKKSEPEAKAEPAFDADKLKDEVKAEVVKDIADKFVACDECKESLGKIEPLAQDSAGSIYLLALKQEGCNTNGVTEETARSVYQAFMQGKRKTAPCGFANDSALKAKVGVIEKILSNVK